MELFQCVGTIRKEKLTRSPPFVPKSLVQNQDSKMVKGPAHDFSNCNAF